MRRFLVGAWITSAWSMVAMMVVVLATATLGPGVATASAAGLPAKDSGNAFSQYDLGFSTVDGVQNLYLSTGNTIYRYDGGSIFTPVATGIRNALGAPQRASDGGLGIGPDGQALALLGYSGTGNVLVDLQTGSLAAAPGVEPPYTDTHDNFYSAASRATGVFYGMYVDPNTFSSTEIVQLTPGAATPARRMLDLATVTTIPGVANYYSGGMAFDATGNLYAGILGYDASFTSATVAFYEITAAALDAYEANPALTPTATLLAYGSAQGNGPMAVSADGVIYFGTTQGIGMVKDGVVSNLLGDINGNPFSLPNLYEGLAYDDASQTLYYVGYNAGLGGYQLDTFTVPEPVTGVLLALAAPGLLLRRRRG